MSQQVGSSSAASIAQVDSLASSTNATTNVPNDTSTPIDEETAPTASGRKTRVLTSTIWEDFDRVGTGNNVVATCKHCKRKFDEASNKGTTHLKNHQKNCALAKRQRVDPLQQFLGKCVTKDNPIPKLENPQLKLVLPLEIVRIMSLTFRNTEKAKASEMIGFSSSAISVLSHAEFSSSEADHSSQIFMDVKQSFLPIPTPAKAAIFESFARQNVTEAEID